uniref:Peptidase M12B domain-containing protein n=1 Tax=Amblyomma maculatum TaxID=34609 RepID=G3MQN5_AMBMU
MESIMFIYVLALISPALVQLYKLDYEPEVIVYPSLLQERSESTEKIVHLGDGSLVNLQKAAVLHETLTVHSFENGRRIVQTVRAEDVAGKLYENKESLASVILDETIHGILMDGLINHSYIIEPSFESERSEAGQVAHKIFKVQSQQATFNESVSEFEVLPEDIRVKIDSRAELPDVFYPDVFVISDYEHNKDFKTTRSFLTYIVVFFNSVKLRYQGVHYPRIIPRLVGIERAERDNEPYVTMHGTQMIAEYTLESLKNYVEGRLDDFRGVDAILMITGRKMISVSTGHIRAGVAGLAMRAGLCTRRRFAESIDTGRVYAGVVYAAHELAHLLGSSHDGAGPVPGIPGNQGAYNCPSSNGNIMSYDYKDENQFTFSYCSQQQFRAFLSIVPERCIENKWEGASPKYSSKYPGDMMSRKKFCRKKSGFGNSEDCTKQSGEEECKITCCPGSDLYGSRIETAEYWLLDGAKCGKNKACYNGECSPKRKM